MEFLKYWPVLVTLINWLLKKLLLKGRWKELNIPGTGEIKTMVMLTCFSAICVLLPYPLSFFFSVLLSSFLLCSAFLSLSSPHCLVVFPPFVLSFFFFLCRVSLLSVVQCWCSCDGEWQRFFPYFKTSSSLSSSFSVPFCLVLFLLFPPFSLFFLFCPLSLWFSFPLLVLPFLLLFFGPSSGFYSMCYGRHMVTVVVHYGGEEISRETCPWLQLHRSRFYHRKRCLKTGSSVQ